MSDADATVASLGEAGLIALFRGHAPPPAGVVVPNGDDAAAWHTPPDHVSVVTTDSLVEGVHFDLTPRLAGDDDVQLAEAAGEKLVSVNVSDLAAMGARPAHVLASIHAPPAAPRRVAEALARGFARGVARYGLHVAGGNVTRIDGPWVLAATVVGEARADRLLTRGRASAGALLVVSGPLGAARVGLACTRAAELVVDDDVRHVLDALRRPSAEVAAGAALVGVVGVEAVTDLSDGLARDVVRLLAPLGVGAMLPLDALPVDAATRRVAARLGLDPRTEALLGGEDYRLLAVVRPEAWPTVLARLPGAAIVGRVDASPECVVVGDGARRALGGGFSHFGEA